MYRLLEIILQGRNPKRGGNRYGDDTERTVTVQRNKDAPKECLHEDVLFECFPTTTTWTRRSIQSTVRSRSSTSRGSGFKCTRDGCTRGRRFSLSRNQRFKTETYALREVRWAVRELKRLVIMTAEVQEASMTSVQSASAEHLHAHTCIYLTWTYVCTSTSARSSVPVSIREREKNLGFDQKPA